MLQRLLAAQSPAAEQKPPPATPEPRPAPVTPPPTSAEISSPDLDRTSRICVQCNGPNDNDARRCLPGKKPGFAWCPDAPWTTSGLTFKTDRLLPHPRDEIWGVELQTGERCNGARGRTYDCSGGATVTQVFEHDGKALGLVQRSGEAEPEPLKTLWVAPGSNPGLNRRPRGR